MALTGLEAYPVSGCEEEGVAGGELRVTVVDGRGWPLPQLCHGGRRYLEGEEGERYLIEIENRGLDQFEVVASVDGLDVMDGERASPLKRGYVVAPRSTLRIDGFRRSGSEVAAFRFGSVAGSYAALKGDDANVGVIAVAVFPERGWAGGWRADRARSDEARRRRLADPFPAAPRFALPPRGY